MDTLIKPAKKTESSGEKIPGFIIQICIFSIVLILAVAGKLLYDKTLENAETENSSINRLASAALDLFFSGLEPASTALLETVSTPGFGSSVERGAVNLFFESNRDIAAVAFYNSAGKSASSLSFINHGFFSGSNIDARLVNIFIELNKAAPEGMRNAVLNCENIFGFPLLVMVFPYKRGGTGLVFFYLSGLEKIFKAGPSTGVLINTAGDILHSGRSPRSNGENISSRPFIRTILSRPPGNGRLRYVDGEGRHTTAAYSKLNAVPAFFITEMTYGAVFSGLAAVALRVGCVAAGLIFFLVLVALLCSRRIKISLKKLTDFYELKRKFEVTSRFADMPLAHKSLEGLLPAGAEYKSATVLLSGIESFAHIAERLNPDDAVALLNKYIKRAAGIVKKTKGTLDQFSDGNVKAYWGALSSSGSAEHDALNCIRCALMLRVAMYELNEERRASGEAPFIRLSCGISSGEFAAGIADSGERAAYTLIGKSGGLAEIAKAQNILYNTDILITESTWHLAKKYILVHELRPLQIEGSPKPLRVFALVNLRTRQGESQVFPVTLQDVRSLYLPEQPSCESEVKDHSILEI
ncbi:MAG: adenylate/guanylate cyclase domain-containing protein [Spirochaetaceae bacterium]|jgi:adenylate cyclase|nr:adenylate/guanylate cyclase domain-containing protein [Spirochaetaceae bacterium]